MNLRDQVDTTKLPNHIAVIMDGNGRWAKQKGLMRVIGHENGTKAVRETVEACAELGVKHLTLYAFSTENWNRPKLEVQTLMKLLVKSLKKEIKTLQENKIKLTAIGSLKDLPKKAFEELKYVEEKTSEDKVAQVVDLTFDLSVHDIFTTWLLVRAYMLLTILLLDKFIRKKKKYPPYF